MPDDPQYDRRRFFRLSLAELLRPLAASVAPLQLAAQHFSNLESPLPASDPNKIAPDLWLRPPGALPEQLFRETCSRCGKCVEVCPAQCIKIDATGVHGAGAPYIDANAMPCVVCTGLDCMGVCPSGALVPTALAEIDMGTAVWREQTCVRRNGEDCRICVDHCPLGEVAIKLVNGQIAVQPNGCIGCGVCQHDCPTDPKSIFVIPKSARTNF